MQDKVDRRGDGVPNWIQRHATSMPTTAKPEARTGVKQQPKSAQFLITR